MAAGTINRVQLMAVCAALAAAALLATVVPQSVQGAGAKPAAAVEVIVRFAEAMTLQQRRAAIRAAGGVVTHDLHLIDGLGARLDPEAAERLRAAMGVASVTPVQPVASRDQGGGRKRKSPPAAYAQAVGVSGLDLTGRDVGVAVIDTGVASGLPDFRGPRGRSRVVATAVVNPNASDDRDGYGHGTHIAGVIAGHRPSRGYVGIAPEARLISVKISDDDGTATTLDAIYGLQFAVDHADALDIDVVNLSLASTVAESPATDPLAAAAEAAWLSGLVVVAAAGNDGDAPDAVHHAPGNDPYLITVGAFDDRGTADRADDTLAPWSSRGVTQTGVAKPDVVAPGAGLVAPLAPGSRYATLCPECVRDGQYFRVSGSSMATAVTSGVVALLLEAHPRWTPDQVKAALGATSGPFLRADRAVDARPDRRDSEQHHPTSELIDPATGAIDYSAASWRAASWRAASWRSADNGWTCDCGLTPEGELDPQAASWRAASWRVRFTP